VVLTQVDVNARGRPGWLAVKEVWCTQEATPAQFHIDVLIVSIKHNNSPVPDMPAILWLQPRRWASLTVACMTF